MMTSEGSDGEPELQSPPVVTCVHCGEMLHWDPAQNEIADHHIDEHPDERYDPIWYDPEGHPPFGRGNA